MEQEVLRLPLSALGVFGIVCCTLIPKNIASDAIVRVWQRT